MKYQCFEFQEEGTDLRSPPLWIDARNIGYPIRNTIWDTGKRFKSTCKYSFSETVHQQVAIPLPIQNFCCFFFIHASNPHHSFNLLPKSMSNKWIDTLLSSFSNRSSFQKHFACFNVFWKLINHSICLTMLKQKREGGGLREDKSQRRKWATLIGVYVSLRMILIEILGEEGGVWWLFDMLSDGPGF
jgi:hypothetical protein